MRLQCTPTLHATKDGRAFGITLVFLTTSQDPDSVGGPAAGGATSGHRGRGRCPEHLQVQILSWNAMNQGCLALLLGLEGGG